MKRLIRVANPPSEIANKLSSLRSSFIQPVSFNKAERNQIINYVNLIITELKNVKLTSESMNNIRTVIKLIASAINAGERGNLTLVSNLLNQFNSYVDKIIIQLNEKNKQ